MNKSVDTVLSDMRNKVDDNAAIFVHHGDDNNFNDERIRIGKVSEWGFKRNNFSLNQVVFG